MSFSVPPLPRANWSLDPSARTSDVGELVRTAQLSTDAPRIPWDVFLKDIFVWQQGEHVGLIGPTGQGKTTLLMHLLPLQKYTVVCATKPKDETMSTLIRQGGYYPLQRWVSLDPQKFPKRVLWPDASKLDSAPHQREVFLDAMGKIYREGGWCFVIDELWFFTNILTMPTEIKIYLTQARALKISMTVATQRPAFVPLEVYDQSTHLFFWRDNDERNLSRLSGISYRSAALVKNLISNLEQYQVLYINTRTGKMYRTRSPK